jgi:hypothetical protein
MAGEDLRNWMLRRSPDRLSAAQVEGVFGEIDRHLIRRDESERGTRPMPRSLAEMARATVVGLGFAAAGFVATGRLLQLVDSILAWIVLALTFFGASELVRRRTRWRWEARTFQYALGGIYLLIAVAVIRAYVGA